MTAIERLEKAKRDLKKLTSERDMWKTTVEQLESGQRLNRIYREELQKMMDEKEADENRELNSSVGIKIEDYDKLLNKSQRAVRTAGYVLGNETPPPEEEDNKEVDEEIAGVCAKPEDGEKSPRTPRGKRPVTRSRPKTRMTKMVPVKESGLESKSGSSIGSSSSGRSHSSVEREPGPTADDLPARAARRQNRDKPWAKSMEYYQDKDRSPNRLSKSLEISSWSRPVGLGRREKTCLDGRDIMVGDQPWGNTASMRREKTWFAPNGHIRDKSLEIGRDERREGRERPWALSKEKRSILKEGSFYDERVQPRAKSEMKRSYSNGSSRPATRAQSEMQNYSRLDSSVGPQREGGRSRMTLSREGTMTQSRPTTGFSGLETPEPWGNRQGNRLSPKSSPKPGKRMPLSVAPLGKGSAGASAEMKPPNAPSEAWMTTPRSRPSTKEVTFYKSPDFAIESVRASNSPERPRTKSSGNKRVVRRAKVSTMRNTQSWGSSGMYRKYSSDPSAEGPLEPVVTQMKPNNTRSNLSNVQIVLPGEQRRYTSLHDLKYDI